MVGTCWPDSDARCIRTVQSAFDTPRKPPLPCSPILSAAEQIPFKVHAVYGGCGGQPTSYYSQKRGQKMGRRGLIPYTRRLITPIHQGSRASRLSQPSGITSHVGGCPPCDVMIRVQPIGPDGFICLTFKLTRLAAIQPFHCWNLPPPFLLASPGQSCSQLGQVSGRILGTPCQDTLDAPSM